jgi:AraC family transcriptional regulator
VAVVLRGGFLGSYGREERSCFQTSVVVEPAGEPHANDFGDLPTAVLALSVREETLRSALPSLAGPAQFSRDPFAADIARRANAELEHPDELMPMAVESAALELLTRLARTARDEGRSVWLNKARDLLHDRYAYPLRLSEVAAEVGVEPERLARTFRRVYGEPMASYLRRLRVHAAASMLATGDLPISQVAAEVGFADQSHLTRCFGRYLGTTPARYRGEHRYR